ncbi:MAG: TrmH family RNA methyltransferase [Chitinophagaceae bacterium]
MNFAEPCAIVVGSEDKGIFPALMKVCDEQFSIPMKNDFESFNVSVAAGMILYETMKQRM